MAEPSTATAGGVVATRRLHGAAAALYRPQGYAAGYAYPLVVLCHDRGDDETAAVRRLAGHWGRNHVLVAVRGPVRLERGFGWGDRRRSMARIEDACDAAVRHASAQCHVHPRRVFLLGVGEGAEVALRLATHDPFRYAGAAAVRPRTDPFAACWQRLAVAGRSRPRPLFLGLDGHAAVPASVRCGSGHVTVRRYPADADDRLHRDLERWLFARFLPTAVR